MATVDIELAKKRIPRGSYFQHYKGGIYRVLTLSFKEDSMQLEVVYENEQGEVFNRPLFAFEELVDFDGKLINRFLKLPHSHWPHWDKFKLEPAPVDRDRNKSEVAAEDVIASYNKEVDASLNRGLPVPDPKVRIRELCIERGLDYDEVVRKGYESIAERQRKELEKYRATVGDPNYAVPLPTPNPEKIAYWCSEEMMLKMFPVLHPHWKDTRNEPYYNYIRATYPDMLEALESQVCHYEYGFDTNALRIADMSNEVECAMFYRIQCRPGKSCCLHIINNGRTYLLGFNYSNEQLTAEQQDYLQRCGDTLKFMGTEIDPNTNTNTNKSIEDQTGVKK